MIDKQLIKQLKDEPSFKKFLEYVVSIIEEYDTVDGLLKMSNDQAGEAGRVRAMTVIVLHQILSPFLEFNEKREPTAKEIEAVKKRVGL